MFVTSPHYLQNKTKIKEKITFFYIFVDITEQV